MDCVQKAYQVLAQVIIRDFKLTKNIQTINGSQLLFIKNWNKENSHFSIRILYLASFNPRKKKPSHSSSVASKDVWLERKWKQKFKGKAEQVLCRYISYYDPPLLFFFYKISEIYKEDIF